MNYIKNYFKDVNVGDEVIDIIDGKIGKIIRIEKSSNYPIKVVFYDESVIFEYTIDGRSNLENMTQTLFYKGHEPKIEIPEPPNKRI